MFNVSNVYLELQSMETFWNWNQDSPPLVEGSAMPHSYVTGIHTSKEPSTRLNQFPAFLRSHSCWLVLQNVGARLRNPGMRSRCFSSFASSEDSCTELRRCSFFGKPSAFLSRHQNGMNVDIFLLRFVGGKKKMVLGSWHSVFAVRSCRPSGWTMPFFFWTSRPSSQF